MPKPTQQHIIPKDVRRGAIRFLFECSNDFNDENLISGDYVSDFNDFKSL